MVLDTEITKTKISPEAKLLLKEIADQSTTEFVRIETEKRMVLAALGRNGYLERSGLDARITGKGLKVIGLPPAERPGEAADTDRVIVEALAKKRTASPHREPIRIRIPELFSERPKAVEPSAGAVIVGAQRAAPVTPLPEFGEGQGVGSEPCAEGGQSCGPDCINRRTLELIYARYPHMREIPRLLKTIDSTLEKHHD